MYTVESPSIDYIISYTHAAIILLVGYADREGFFCGHKQSINNEETTFCTITGIKKQQVTTWIQKLLRSLYVDSIIARLLRLFS